jgi:DNA-binding MarR family transcriptional regulator
VSRHRSADEHQARDLSSQDLPEIPSAVTRKQLRSVEARSMEAESRAPNTRDRDEPSLERSYYLRDRSYVLRESQFATLLELGKFRVINADDLARFAYAGDTESLARDIRPLEKQGLLLRRSLPSESTKARRLLTLTKRGKRLLLASGRIEHQRTKLLLRHQ